MEDNRHKVNLQKNRWLSRINAKKDRDTKEEKDKFNKAKEMLSETL